MSVFLPLQSVWMTNPRFIVITLEMEFEEEVGFIALLHTKLEKKNGKHIS